MKSECVTPSFYQTTNREDEIRTRRDYDKAKESRRRLLAKSARVEWKNREWKSEEQIVRGSIDSWMDSHGHRRGFLKNYWTHTGVGVAFVGDFFVITQMFIQK